MQSSTAAAAYRHRRHHDRIFNPNPNPNPNTEPPKPNRRLISLVLKSIIMILIASLFFIFLSIASLVVLHFFLAGGHHLRRRHRRSTATDLRRSLPTVRYDGDTEEGCAVCLEPFRAGDRCRVLPDCGHVYHAGCVDAWLVRRDNCPVCRTRVRLDLGPTGLGDGGYKGFWAVGV